MCIYRIPRKESIIYPSSHCPKCGTPLKFYDNIPVLSYIFLKGRCRYCGARISILYPFIEILTGVLYLLAYMYKGENLISFFSSLIFLSFLIIITFIDLKYMIIPDILVFLAVGIAIFFIILGGGVHFYDSLFGGIIGGGIIFFIVFLSRGGMGEGDIKFSFMIGLFLGVKYTIMTLIISFIIGGVVGILLLLFKIKKGKDAIPFGPFLSIGAIISLFWGDIISKIWGWY